MSNSDIEILSAVGSICAFVSVLIAVYVIVRNDWMKMLENIESEYFHRDTLLEQDLRNKKGNFWLMINEHNHRFQCEYNNKFEDIISSFVSAKAPFETRLFELFHQENVCFQNLIEALGFPREMTFDCWFTGFQTLQRLRKLFPNANLNNKNLSHPASSSPSPKPDLSESTSLFLSCNAEVAKQVVKDYLSLFASITSLLDAYSSLILNTERRLESCTETYKNLVANFATNSSERLRNMGMEAQADRVNLREMLEEKYEEERNRIPCLFKLVCCCCASYCLRLKTHAFKQDLHTENDRKGGPHQSSSDSQQHIQELAHQADRELQEQNEPHSEVGVRIEEAWNQGRRAPFHIPDPHEQQAQGIQVPGDQVDEVQLSLQEISYHPLVSPTLIESSFDFFRKSLSVGVFHLHNFVQSNDLSSYSPAELSLNADLEQELTVTIYGFIEFSKFSLLLDEGGNRSDVLHNNFRYLIPLLKWMLKQSNPSSYPQDMHFYSRARFLSFLGRGQFIGWTKNTTEIDIEAYRNGVFKGHTQDHVVLNKNDEARDKTYDGLFSNFFQNLREDDEYFVRIQN